MKIRVPLAAVRSLGVSDYTYVNITETAASPADSSEVINTIYLIIRQAKRRPLGVV